MTVTSASNLPSKMNHHDLRAWSFRIASRLDAIVIEAHRALRLHGEPTADPARMIANLTKELGEAAQEATKMTSADPAERRHDWNDVRVGSAITKARITAMREELIQVATLCMGYVVQIDEGKVEQHVNGNLKT